MGEQAAAHVDLVAALLTVNISRLADDVVAADPSRTALIVGDREISYADVERAVARCASALADHGVGPRDRVAVVAAGGLLSTAAILGAARVGGAAALMNVQLKPAEMGELVRAAGCAPVGIADEAFRDLLRKHGRPIDLKDALKRSARAEPGEPGRGSRRGRNGRH